jgi:hypothetical protein
MHAQPQMDAGGSSNFDVIDIRYVALFVNMTLLKFDILK